MSCVIIVYYNNNNKLILLLYDACSPNPPLFGCTGDCPLTYCRACYNFVDLLPPSRDCPGCKNALDYHHNSKCFKSWSMCVRKSNSLWKYGRVSCTRLKINFKIKITKKLIKNRY